MSIGGRIRQARTRASLTQRKLAAALGVSPALVAHWENGNRNPGVRRVCQIAELTLTEPAWLLVDEDHGNSVKAQLLPDEEALLILYRRMSQRQRENLQKLMHMSFGVQLEGQSQRQPAHS